MTGPAADASISARAALPRISVLLPIYNGRATLGRAALSIQQQSVSDWELILLDDGSKDGSFELCRELASQDDRVRAERHEQNRGLGAAMSSLVQLARGSYLAVQEQDDFSLPGRLEAEARVLDEEPRVGLVSGVAEWVDARGERLRLFPDLLARGGQYPQRPADMVRYLMVEQCKIVNAGCMFRREVLGESVFFDSEARMSVDWQFFLRLAHRHRVHGLGEIVVQVERDAERTSLTAQKELQFAEARRCLARMLEDFADDPASPIDRRLYRQALATQLLLEARYYGGLPGVAGHLGALCQEPGRVETWRSLAELVGRGFSKLTGRAGGRRGGTP